MGISNRGTKAKTITSCDNAFVTNIGAAAASLSRKKHLLARDPGAQAKRQRQSAQSERKSTPHFAEEPLNRILISLTLNASCRKWKIYILHSKYLKSRCSMNIQGNFSNTSQLFSTYFTTYL
ncbi:hypothetical protein [Lysinibacillus sp. RC79]|uniref:hypothetical protein n=1 Tax=Lysinibacillus sp. RC79 TaxID=3156296 RepID=UPI003516521F